MDACGADAEGGASELAQIIGQAQKGVYVDPSRTTLIEYLDATWLPAKASGVKPSTAELYGTLVAAYVRPRRCESPAATRDPERT